MGFEPTAIFVSGRRKDLDTGVSQYVGLAVCAAVCSSGEQRKGRAERERK
jgi:hypothetical protein